MHDRDRRAVLSGRVPVSQFSLKTLIPSLVPEALNQIPELWSHLRGQVKGPEEKSEHAARQHGDDRERQQPVPLAVVLHVRPDFRRHQSLPQCGHALHPDLDSVSILADPRPPPPGGPISQKSGVLRRVSANPARHQAECSQRRTDRLWVPSHVEADPVWGEETLTKGFLVKPDGLSLPAANRGSSTQVLLKKASALISPSSYSSLRVTQPIHKKTTAAFPM